MKFEFMKNHTNEFKIGKMALVLQVSRKGYYKHLSRNQAKKIIYACSRIDSSFVFEYIEVFCNRERTHSTLKYVSPLQFEQRYLISGQSRMKLAQPAIEAIINF